MFSNYTQAHKHKNTINGIVIKRHARIMQLVKEETQGYIRERLFSPKLSHASKKWLFVREIWFLVESSMYLHQVFVIVRVTLDLLGHLARVRVHPVPGHVGEVVRKHFARQAGGVTHFDRCVLGARRENGTVHHALCSTTHQQPINSTSTPQQHDSRWVKSKRKKVILKC